MTIQKAQSCIFPYFVIEIATPWAIDGTPQGDNANTTLEASRK
jgi:hypothetical protein